jgi:hypothetical protein
MAQFLVNFHPSNPLNLFHWKVASSEAFTLVDQFWPLLVERSNYAQIKLNLQVLSGAFIFEKHPT